MVVGGSSSIGTWTSWWCERARDVDPVVAAAARQGFVLGTAQVRDLGVARSTARTRVRRGTWSAPAVGVVAPLDIDDGESSHVVRRREHALLTAAGVLRNPGQVAAARSAAVLHGLPTMQVPERAHFLSPVARGPAGLRTSTHRHATGPVVLASWFGVDVLTVPRTVVDLARHDRWDGLMAADAALHAGLTTHDALAIVAAGQSGWPGVEQARTVLALSDGRAESPLESVSRLRMHDARLPPPELQYGIDGYRADFCWPDRRFVLEADGLEKYSDDALRAEKRRERHLRACGYRVERVTWDEVVRQWPRTLEWLAAALVG